MIHCRDCAFWSEQKYEWMGARPCKASSDLFFVGGGEGNDGLYTSPYFGCVVGIRRTDGALVTLSPSVPENMIVLKSGDEVKVIKIGEDEQ